MTTSIIITIETNLGKSADLELPDGVPVEALIPLILDGMGWGGADDAAELVIRGSRATLHPSDTLTSRGILTGDTLYLAIDRPLTFKQVDGPALVDLTGRVYPMRGNVLVGRPNAKKGVTVDVDLSHLPENSHVSRPHVRITYQDGTYILQDMGSRNGTFINKRKIPSGQFVALKNRDVIRLGQSGPHLQFQWQDLTLEDV